MIFNIYLWYDIWYLPVQCCPKGIKTTLNKIFHVHCCLEPLGQHCIWYLPVQCRTRSIKTTLNKIFPVSGCLEPLGQHYTRFLAVFCCPKGIKTTLIRIFLLCNVVRSFLDNIVQGFYLLNACPWLTDIFYEENNLCNVALIMLVQHCIGILPSQCWLVQLLIEKLIEKLLVQCWPRAHRHVFVGK